MVATYAQAPSGRQAVQMHPKPSIFSNWTVLGESIGTDVGPEHYPSFWVFWGIKMLLGWCGFVVP
jgi:hypothetical protein